VNVDDSIVEFGKKSICKQQKENNEKKGTKDDSSCHVALPSTPTRNGSLVPIILTGTKDGYF
jgi:hypothetical protein